MDKFKKEFPVLKQYTYFNTASSGLLYNSLATYRQEHDLDFLTSGSLFRENQYQLLTSVKQTIGAFFKCTLGRILLTPNFSLGINTLLTGIDATKKVLLLDIDYPSVNFSVTSKGFTVCYAQIDEQLEHNILQAVKEHSPAIFICSLVQYTNGVMIDLNFLQELKATYPAMLIIADGTQFCGTKVFDFDNSGIDILGCSGYKWLLGGYGNGFLIFKKGVLEEITPVVYTNNAAVSAHEDSYTTMDARYECGHLDTLNFGSLRHSLNFLSTIGVSNIEHMNKELTTYAKEELEKLQLIETAIIRRTTHSSIFNIKGDVQLYTQLKEHNIITSLKGKGLRISLHFYNTTEELTKLFEVLHRYC